MRWRELQSYSDLERHSISIPFFIHTKIALPRLAALSLILLRFAFQSFDPEYEVYPLKIAFTAKVTGTREGFPFRDKFINATNGFVSKWIYI